MWQRVKVELRERNETGKNKMYENAVYNIILLAVVAADVVQMAR